MYGQLPECRFINLHVPYTDDDSETETTFTAHEPERYAEYLTRRKKETLGKEIKAKAHGSSRRAKV